MPSTAVLQKKIFQREISLSLSSVWCFLIAAQFMTQCVREKRDFYKEILMSSNQLCMIFKDKATADLKN